ncbi:MAG: BON domain-containing protein [bacterium]
MEGRAFFLHRVRGKFFCKLSLRQTLRHRLYAMSYLRFRDEDESSVAGTVTSVLLGALAGFAVGMVVAQRVGGFSGLADRFRRGGTDVEENAGPVVADDFADEEDYDDDEIEEESEASGLEEHVLEAFRNDPILSERAIDIGGIGEATIELAGWVKSDDEAEHAVTIARGVPGVSTVLNRIAVGDEEERIADHARLFAEGDDAHTEAHWEGNVVGTGRRRQGTSDEPDRHADPRVNLHEKWTSADAELREAADDIEGIAERRVREKKAPVKGVPKGDHVTPPGS